MSAAIDWHPVLDAIKSNLVSSITTVRSDSVTWYKGKLNVDTRKAPLGVIYDGNSSFDVVQLGVENSRKKYREEHEIYIELATYKRAKGSKDNPWDNAHDQLMDFIKATLDEISADIYVNSETAGNNDSDNLVDDSTIVEVRKDAPVGNQDEELATARITMVVVKEW